MKRKVVGIALFCLLLLVAIFAGYWDMLNTEKVRLARETTGQATDSVAALVDPAGPSGAQKPADGATTADAGAEGAASTEAASGAATSGSAGPDRAAAPEAPSFDILRVEPDGSTVMAGKAPAGSTVRLVDGTTTLGQETAGPAGDFAIVLDKPLAVGEHQIRIEAAGGSGPAVTSRETAIVSVPQRGRENELLALVETPDAPSRLISVPTPGVVAAREGGEAMTAAGTSAAATGADGALPSSASGEEARQTTDAAPADGLPETGPALTQTATATATDPTRAAAAPVVGPVAGNGTAPAPAGETSAAPPAASTSPYAGSATTSAPAVTSPTPATAGTAPGILAVEAVEIEDRTIYVAGRKPLGHSVRIYVDNVFLGEDANRGGDRFLVTSSADVLAGEHLVRADQLAADGTVLARVEVPFLKPEGRAMSAIAGAPGAGATGEAGAGNVDARGEAVSRPASNATAPAGSTPSPSSIASADAPANDPLDDRASPSGSPQPATAAPSPGETPAAPPETVKTPVPRSTGGSLEGTAPDAAPPTIADPAPDVAGSAPATAPDGEPSGLSAAGPASVRPAPDEPSAGTRDAATTPSGTEAARSPDLAAAADASSVAGGASSADVATERQAPLEAAGARVIIRRGDTLWRISRDTYGRGARYTTIYLANGDQIRDPNRIYPGQVFRMPEDRVEDASAPN
ncbi:hypothetical protein ASG43_06015 [Aureimonas sp. Leaf454]|uniref:LysM peptidoglycan-binding domain-containing protein n=1 Tax=Aureimonas sp. Leaf454 TaxID=1736381 RepID=UPI0006FE2BBC|nr:LysM peptidoglycan-binding domain-containing protein [Aureimonas sp. Leaf454]KQT50818.1 hypothetical protein ASG43_06015 [Aureimonas sp. Leaf454]